MYGRRYSAQKLDHLWVQSPSIGTGLCLKTQTLNKQIHSGSHRKKGNERARSCSFCTIIYRIWYPFWYHTRKSVRKWGYQYWYVGIRATDHQLATVEELVLLPHKRRLRYYQNACPQLCFQLGLQGRQLKDSVGMQQVAIGRAYIGGGNTKNSINNRYWTYKLESRSTNDSDSQTHGTRRIKNLNQKQPPSTNTSLRCL